MSQIIYSEYFISINWEIKEYDTSSLIKAEPSDVSSDIEIWEDIAKQLHLIFTIQVNWKLKTFEWYFTLVKCSTWITLEQWGEWYAIINLLTSLWYKIWDYEIWKPWANIILNWIDKLNN